MRLPRDISGKDLITALKGFDYNVTRQTGSHVRLTTHKNGVHNITIPLHNPLRVGTLSNIVRDIAAHFKLTRTELLQLLFKQS